MDRIEKLEQRIQALEHGQSRLERTATDSEGRQWRLQDFLQMGLNRRQALGVLAAIGGGATLGTALSQQVKAQPTGNEGAVGQSGDPVELWASEIDATEIATEQATINDVAGRGTLGASQTISTSTFTQMNLDTAAIEDSNILTVDTANDKITITTNGTYLIKGRLTWSGSANWTAGDRVLTQLSVGGSFADSEDTGHHGGNNRFGQIVRAMVEITSNTDVFLRAYHERGGDESLDANSTRTHLEVTRAG